MLLTLLGLVLQSYNLIVAYIEAAEQGGKGGEHGGGGAGMSRSHPRPNCPRVPGPPYNDLRRRTPAVDRVGRDTCCRPGRPRHLL